jgi:hypothetical protein
LSIEGGELKVRIAKESQQARKTHILSDAIGATSQHGKGK